MKKIFNSDNAPRPIGPYSHANIASGEMIFISGQIALNLDGEMVGDNVSDQTRKSLENMRSILNDLDCEFTNIVKCTVLLANMDDFAEMNEVYDEFFGESKPARAAFAVKTLPKNALVEIEAIAVR